MLDRFDWSGVFPAATTQLTADLSVDLRATQKVQSALVDDGVHGLVLMGTVGENNSLTPDEKIAVLKAAKDAVGGRVPLIVGVSELTTSRAAAFAAEAEAAGADGLMVLPAMVYVATEDELIDHFQTVAAATSLPIMLYNNPPAYRVEISLNALGTLSKTQNIVALKESSPNTRRFTDIANNCADRYRLLVGLDDIALEGLMLGAVGWVSGLTNAFPRESLALYEAAVAQEFDRALEIYRWFMPLLHLDAAHDLVQSIKLCEQMMGRGSERVRPPRLLLKGARREEIVGMVEKARSQTPLLAMVA